MAASRIEELKQLIAERYSCDATHISTVPVREKFEDETVWEGNVEVFHVSGLPDVDACYAWYCHHDPAKAVTVLERPPVYSAGSAVRTVVAEKKKKQP